jgi:hypothetical protein
MSPKGPEAFIQTALELLASNRYLEKGIVKLVPASASANLALEPEETRALAPAHPPRPIQSHPAPVAKV